jgi:hypothetical protein
MTAKYICQNRSDKGEVCGGEAGNQKGVVFTGKNASDLYANDPGVLNERSLNMGFVICT